MKVKTSTRLFLILAIFLVAFPTSVLASTAPPVDMFQLPWEQGKAWYPYDGLDNGLKRSSTSPHNYNMGGALDFAPRAKMTVGEDTSNDWVTAAAAGTVYQVGSCFVKIDHGNGWTTEYWHLDNIQVTTGTKVSRNQRLAIIHNNKTQQVCIGNEYPGPHLHFVFRPKVLDTRFAGWNVNYNLFTNITTFSKSGQTVGRLQPLMNIPDLQIANRGILDWNINYEGNVDAYRQERWSLMLVDVAKFEINVSPKAIGLVPVIVLLDASGNEITRASGTLSTTQPAGFYYVDVRSEAGTGYYNIIATKSESGGSTVTPSPTVTETGTLTPTPTSTLNGSETPTATGTLNGSETPTATGTLNGSETPTATGTLTGSETPPATETHTPTPILPDTNTPEPGTDTPTPTVTPSVTFTPTSTPDFEQTAIAATQTANAATLTSIANDATQTAIFASETANAATLTAIANGGTQTAIAATQTFNAQTQTAIAGTLTATADAATQTAIVGTQTAIAGTLTATADAATQTSVAATLTANPDILTAIAATQTSDAAMQTAIAGTLTAQPGIQTAIAGTATANALTMTASASTFTPSPTVTSTVVPTPVGPYVLVDVIQSTLPLNQTSLVNVSLNNVPAEGYTSAEFVCSYDPAIVEVNNILAAELFGSDPASALSGPQNGQFILAIAGSNGKKATSSGTALTFSVRGLQAGQTTVQCTARVSMGQGSLEAIAYVPDLVTVIDTSVTPTPTTGGVNGQVIASKPVTIRLYDAVNTLVISQVANPDGTFSLQVPAGTYTIIASADGFLNAQGFLTITNGGIVTKSTINLPAGDIDGNSVIDQFDALTIGMNYSGSLPAAADLNSDGMINVLDLELLAANYRLSGALSWQ